MSSTQDSAAEKSQKLYEDMLIRYTELKQYIYNLPNTVEAKKLENFYCGQLAEHVALQNEGTAMSGTFKRVSAEYFNSLNPEVLDQPNPVVIGQPNPEESAPSKSNESNSFNSMYS